MDNFKLQDLKTVGNNLYKDCRLEFQIIWNETLVLVNKMKSVEITNYGKKWIRMIYKNSKNRENIKYYYFILKLKG